MKNENADNRIAELEAENALLRRTIQLQKRQMQNGADGTELRRLRARLAEWEGNTKLINGGYYHGDRFIRPFLDGESD